MNLTQQQASACHALMQSLGQPVHSDQGQMRGIFREGDETGQLRRRAGSEGITMAMTCPKVHLLVVDADQLQDGQTLTVADKDWVIVPHSRYTTANGLISLQLMPPSQVAGTHWR